MNMHLPFEWFVALRYLFSKRKHTFISLITVISMIGVFVGVMALIVVIAVMEGFQSHLKEKFLGINAHIVVRNYNGAFEDTSRLREKILSTSSEQGWSRAKITSITPMCFIQGLLSSNRGVSGALIRGVDPKTVRSVLDIGKVVDGEGLDALGNNSSKIPPLLAGEELLKNLGIGVGEELQIVLPRGTITPFGFMPKIRDFKVIGKISTGMYDYDSSVVFISLRDAQDLLGLKNKIHAYELRVSNVDQADAIAETLQRRLGFPFWTMDWKRMSRNLFAALRLEKIAMFVVLTLIILVAAFNIVSTLFMLVMEKREDIAILKAMGATDSQILRIFVYTGFSVGLLGTVLGVIGGVGLCELLKKYQFIKIPKEVYFTDSLPILLDWKDVVVIAVSALVLSLLATIYPARQAAKINPSEALRLG